MASGPINAPIATGAVRGHSQAVAAPLTRAAIFLVLTVNPGPENLATVRSFCPDLAALFRAVETRDLEGGLTCIMGFGSDAWDHLFGAPRPAGLHPFREIRAGNRHAVSTPGDLFFHIRAKRMDLCFELETQIMARLEAAVSAADEVQGFHYFDDRDLIGFVDGTENPRGDAAVDAVLVGDEDPAFAGGSYVIVQKYFHDLDAWNRLSTEQQERIIGRSKLSDVELDDSVKPTSAHSALTTIVEDGKEIKILRDNMSFGRPGYAEFGTYFIGYSRSPRTTEQMLDNMFIGRPPGNYDRLLDFSRAVTGSLFFVPTATFLDTVGDEAPAHAHHRVGTGRRFEIAGTRRRPRRVTTMARSASGHSKEKSPMNNLHRELAPISDAAWAQIEDEASRTLKRYLAGRRVVDVSGPAGSALSAIGTGHLRNIAAQQNGIIARQREVMPLVELRIPFALDRKDIDDVERGANDSDWQPAKDAARQLAYAEDGAIFDGYPAAGIVGMRKGTSNPVMTLPSNVSEYPETIAQGLSRLRLVGVNGPYAVLLGADAYTLLSETSDHGYPVLEHVKRLVDDKIIWAPAIQGAFVITTRGGDFDLHIGQDASIGYLSHTDTEVRLYLQETFTFLYLTSEAAVAVSPPGKAKKGSKQALSGHGFNRADQTAIIKAHVIPRARSSQRRTLLPRNPSSLRSTLSFVFGESIQQARKSSPRRNPRKIPRLSPHRNPRRLRANHQFPKSIILNRIRRVISQLIRRSQFLSNLPEISMRVGDLRIHIQSAGFPRDAIHHANPVFIPRRQLPVLFFRVANRKHRHIRFLRRFDRGHHVVRAGIIFAVAENQKRPPPGLAGQFFFHRVKNRIVESRAQHAFFARPNLRKIRNLVLKTPQPLNQRRPRRREIVHQTQVIPKANQKHAILRPQDLLQKNFQSLLMRLIEMALALASIHNQPERKRHIRAPRKKRNRLRHSILKYLHIVLSKRSNKSPRRIPRRKTNINKIHLNANRRLRPRSAAGK